MKNKTIAIIGTIVICVTVLLFFTLVWPRTIMQLASFQCIILAELIVTIGSILLVKYANRTAKTMILAGMSTVLLIYAAVSVSVSLLFLFSPSFFLSTLICIQVVLLAIAAIVSLLMITATKSVAKEDLAVRQAVTRIKAMQDDAFMLTEDPANKAYHGKLEKIYEAIRYCDNATYAPSDDKIALKLMELTTALQAEGDDKEPQIHGIINEIMLLTKKRALEVQNMKAGGV